MTANLYQMLSGDMTIVSPDDKHIDKTLAQLERSGYLFDRGPFGPWPDVLTCTQSPHDALLAKMKEFRHDA